MSKRACIIIPAYNEEGNITTVAAAVEEVFKNLAHDYYILFADDGSTDNTLSIIEELSRQNSKIKFISNLIEPETNILVFEILQPYTPDSFTEYLAKNDVLAFAISSTQVRMVTHLDIADEMVTKLISIIDKM